MLSIPLWSDFIFFRVLRIDFLCFYLSIPLWSDFIHALWVCVRSPEHHFQSHYGLILSWKASERAAVWELPFNPTMVWFYPLFRNPDSSSSLSLSIPLWSDFIRGLRNQPASEHLSFQSHYGLILSCCFPRNLNAPLRTFNPTMVWFYLGLVFGLTLTVMLLSIPLWSDFIVKEKLRTSVSPAWDLSIPLWSDFIHGSFS